MTNSPTWGIMMGMQEKGLIKKLHFSPKEKMAEVFCKTYASGYTLVVDFEKGTIDYGKDIKSDSKTTQNFSQPENFVVLECVDRLLTKGYKPQDITLEKIFPAGHGHSGRLDILVTATVQNERKAFLMIECKAFDTEFSSIAKNGGQLFTYFQNDTKADYLMLYTSRLFDGKVEYRSEIIKIEDSYRNAGNVEDTYNRWNKITYANGIFEDAVAPYAFQNKLLALTNLKPLTVEDSGVLFHGFASILRKHCVSDKPNAFNKIFNLFLAKLYDEWQCDTDKKRDTAALDFQWKEGLDTDEDFQVRLINLHKEGVKHFLEKEIEGLSEEEIAAQHIADKQQYKRKWLKFNKIFDLKDVNDDDSFDDNARVLKEVVALLSQYQIRYPRRQQHLSDFFERLLTTGLKQEAGQYFTPVPITRFIAYSLPLKEKIIEEVNQPNPEARLPAVIDYAAGSGHFLTEILEIFQDIINTLDTSDFYRNIQKDVKSWQSSPYSWASRYIYGIEKDYRLVKVAKVGCYFYGDGLAQVINGDGLDSFEHSKTYRGLLQKNKNNNPQFSVVVSNPPYSVDAFKGDLRNADAKTDFSLYPYLTDRSSEIECLFVERTAHLLKEGGVAGIILPSSILTNTGIYTKTREILLEKFEIVAITELGSNTFMATGTNTVVLFLRRRNDARVARIKDAAYQLAVTYAADKKDLTTGGIEEPVAKYFAHTGAADLDPQKLFYFILTCNQTVVLVKTGEKDAEKRFLGYYFSDSRGSEGIHPINGRSTIEECTKLFDANSLKNPQKASTYIYNAFNGNFDLNIDESLNGNISYTDLVDLLTFDNQIFEKQISLIATKKVKLDTQWEEVGLGKIAHIIRGVTYSKNDQTFDKTENIILTADNITLSGSLEIKKEIYLYEDFDAPDEKRLKQNDIFMCFSSGSKTHLGKVAFIENDTNYFAGGFMGIIRTNDSIKPKYLFQLLNSLLRQAIRDLGSGSNINNLSGQINTIKIPLPPMDIQQKIVAEIEAVEKQEQNAGDSIVSHKKEISNMFQFTAKTELENLETIALLLKRGKSAKYGNSTVQIIKSGQARGYREFDFSKKYFVDESFIPDERKLQKNDILINSTGVGTAGRVTLFNLEGDFVVDSHITILRVDTNIANPVFVLYALAEYIGFKNIEAMAQGQSGQIELSLSIIQNIKIPLPPLPEQQKIVAEIEGLEKRITEAQKHLGAIPAQKEAVLRKYL